MCAVCVWYRTHERDAGSFWDEAEPGPLVLLRVCAAITGQPTRVATLLLKGFDWVQTLGATLAALSVEPLMNCQYRIGLGAEPAHPCKSHNAGVQGARHD